MPVFITTLAALLLAMPAVSQRGASAQGENRPSGYVIGPQDVLTITVFNEQDLSNNYRVDEDGMVTFPLIGRVAAGGLTLGAFEEKLKTQLSNGYLKSPSVRVEVNQYKSQRIFIVGEVRSPGSITMTGATMSLIEALALAGSPMASASNELIVVHPTKPGQHGAATLPGDDSKAETRRVNIKDLQVGKAGQDVVLRDGDTIFVPKAQTFYITGQVKNPGQYVLDPGMTVTQAIALAGGLTDRGSNRRIKVVRVVNGVRIEISVDETDVVQPGDTIQISPKFF
jgi:polysaccharide export outer membrane protein